MGCNAGNVRVGKWMQRCLWMQYTFWVLELPDPGNVVLLW